MPRKKNIDIKKLVAAVESERSSKEIMEEFDIGNLTQLKSLYVDALMELGKIPQMTGRRSESKSDVLETKEIKVNKRGSLIVPRELIDEMGFGIGETFSVQKSPAGVSLKRQDNSSSPGNR